MLGSSSIGSLRMMRKARQDHYVPLARMKVRNGRGTGTLCLAGSILKGIYMNRMNPVDTGIRHPIDGGTERHRTSTLMIAVAVAILVGGGMMFYSLFNSPSATVATDYSPIADSFRSLEASRPGPTPPTTIGQGGNRIAK
jgi:hypothetical protein